MGYTPQGNQPTRVISFWTQKGGMGKTTLTLLTSLHLYYQGHRVLLLDADHPQYSIMVTRREELNHITADPLLRKGFNDLKLKPLEIKKAKLADLKGNLAKYKASGDYDYIFVDIAGTMMMDGLDYLTGMLDIVLIPMEMDVKSFVSGFQTIDYFTKKNPALKLFMYWNRTKKSESKTLMNSVDSEVRKKGAITILKSILYDSVQIKRDVSVFFPPVNTDVLQFMNELADYGIGRYEPVPVQKFERTSNV